MRAVDKQVKRINRAKQVNRADLLYMLNLSKDNLAIAAEMIGFVAPIKRTVTLKMPDLPRVEDERKIIRKANPKVKPQQGKQAYYYRVIEQKQSKLLPEPVLGITRPKPPWYQAAERLNPDAIKPASNKPPIKEPLVVWSKLWPLLQSLFSEIKQIRQPDIPRIIKTVANGELLERIPRKTRQRWTATVQILVDRPERTCLFNQDYNQLLAQLKQLRGTIGLDIQKIIRQPGGRVQVEHGKNKTVQDWYAPLAGTKVFILSDLGLLDKSGIALKAWLSVGKRLQLAGCYPMALLPLPERYLTPDLVRLFKCVSWHRSSRLQPVSNIIPRDETVETLLQKDAPGAEQLLAWLSPAVRVEPALLRAVRHHLPIQQVDVGHEAAAWHHDDVEPSRIGFHFQTKTLQAYRQQFKQQADENPVLAKTITKLIRDYHCHVFPTQRDEELLILAQLMGDKLSLCDQQEVEQAKQAMCQLVKASIEQGKEIPALNVFLEHLFERQHAEVLIDNECYQVIRALRKSEQGIDDETSIPEGWNLETVLAFLESKANEMRDYVLFQTEMQTLQLATRQDFQDGLDDFTQGSLLAEFKTASGYLLKQSRDEINRTKNTLIPLANIESLSLKKSKKQSLHIAGQELTVEQFTKPDWATSVGRNHDALTITTRSEKGLHTWYWNPPSTNSLGTKNTKSYKGLWYSELINDVYSLKHPKWANILGWDLYGLYADTEIFGITQRFRWVEPTSFLMGSPEDEEGRYSNETQHSVILAQGYWLADTTCTQALWQAVMKDNPSSFKGELKPVENVSWKDVEDFLKRLNKHYPELNLRLPSEAEWENACRSETTTAFNFGGELSLDKVNYRGIWEYESDEWGEGALHQTADVKDEKYQPNAWGLYQMHGNVWEWCQDWYAADYPTESVVDPQGAESGDYRVLRGGSWIGVGRDCRSACRDRGDPAERIDRIGFRLARGHEHSSVRSVRAGQQPTGSREESAARGGQTGDGMRALDKSFKYIKGFFKK